MTAATIYRVFDLDKDPNRSLAAYRACNAQQAINRFLADQAATASTFRKSQPMARFGNLVARKAEG